MLRSMPAAAARRALLAVYANRDLRLVELARAATVTAAAAFGTLFAVLVYRAGGASALGVLVVAQMVTTAVASPLGAAVGDRFRHTAVMIAADLGRLAIAAGALAADAADAPAGIFIALALTTAVCGTASAPARSALVPSLARTPAELTAANVVASTIQNLGGFAGPALAGGLLAAGGHAAALVATGVLCAVSATLLVPVRGGGEHLLEDRAAARLTEGLRELVRDPGIALLSALFALQSLIAGALGVVMVVIAVRLLDLGDSGVGFVGAAAGVGGLIGAAATLAVIGRRALSLGIGAGFVLWGIALALIGAWPQPVFALVLFGVVGLAEAVPDICALTLLQRVVRPELLARVFGALGGVFYAAGAVGAAFAPVLLRLLGARGTLLAAATVLPVAAIASWRRLARLEALAPVSPAVELMRGIEFLAALEPPTLERLAETAARHELAPNDTLFRQGDPGDRFYVVAAGELSVAVDGREVGRVASGQYVGEIALIRNVPRTATVAARAAALLYAVDRDEFLDALSGTPSALAAAEAAAAARFRRAAPGGVPGPT
jgi:MFS family permease